MISLAVHVWSYAWLPDVPVPILVVAGVAVWCVAAVVAAGVVGRAIARRDTQVPPEPPLRAVAECPTDPCPGIHTHPLEEL